MLYESRVYLSAVTCLLKIAKSDVFLKNQTLRYAAIAIAVICFILPDPFLDILAFWLLAKVGYNYKSLFKKLSMFLRNLGRSSKESELGK